MKVGGGGGCPRLKCPTLVPPRTYSSRESLHFILFCSSEDFPDMHAFSFASEV